MGCEQRIFWPQQPQELRGTPDISPIEQRPVAAFLTHPDYPRRIAQCRLLTLTSTEHQLDDLVERRPRAVLRDQPAHLERVVLDRQPERRVQRSEPLGPRGLVQVARQRHLAVLRLEGAGCPTDLRPRDAIDAADLHQPLLRRPQIDVRLHQLTQ